MSRGSLTHGDRGGAKQERATCLHDTCFVREMVAATSLFLAKGL